METVYRIDGSHIRNLSPGSLANLPSLKYLHLAGSKLTKLDSGVLEGLNGLVLANFTGNDISWVHPRAFRHMENLQEVSYYL